MKPNVYVPHLPTRPDPVTGGDVPTINLQPAARIGELNIINRSPKDAADDAFPFAASRIRNALQTFTADDYILMCGDVVLCAIAIHEAMLRVDGVKVLRWNRDARNYDLLTTPTKEETSQ